MRFVLGAEGEEAMTVRSARGTWTVFVFMTADEGHGVFTNNEIDTELSAIEHAINLHPGARIVVQADRRDSKGLRCFVENGRFKREPLQKEPRSGDVDQIVEFLNFGRARHPSEHSLVLFWGHGFGPSGLFYESPPPLDPPKLRKALCRGFGLSGPVDIVGFMSCHMSTIELAYELAEWRFPPLPITRAANFVVASQGTVKPKQAFPYDELFRTLLNAESSPIEVGKHLVDSLGTKYDAPFALLDVSRSDAARRALAALASPLVAVNPFVVRHSTISGLRKDLHDALGEAKADDEALLDLVRLGRKVAAIRSTSTNESDGSSNQQARNAAKGLVETVEGSLVVHTGPRGTGARELNGVSVYCPAHHGSDSLVEELISMDRYRELGLSKSVLGKCWIDVVRLASEAH